ncbi:MAG: SpoIIE family protein phosphatase [Bryobacterales bacterium]|nr:SpoIIE family protein phosphatase [Bryobacterales bacterium]
MQGNTCDMSSLELAIQQPDGTNRSVPLHNQQRIQVGRASDNDLPYPDEAILSRRHLAFEFDGQDWWAEDLRSKNGSMVNGEALTGRRKLKVGDRVSVGRLVIVLIDAHQSDSTANVIFEEEDLLGHTVLTPGRISTSLEQVVGHGAGGLEAALRSPSLAGTPRVQALLDAGRELAGHRPLKELFRVILDLATKSVGARRGVLMLEEADGTLTARAATGAGFRISNAVRERVMRHKESLLILDVALHEDLRESHTIVQQGIRSFLAVPLQTQDKTIGLVYVDSGEQRLRRFTEEDLTLLTVMANIAAIRIENERLAEVEQVERMMKKELEQAADIQRNLLPRHPPPVDGLELAAFSYPCRSVGGDYFDYLKMPGGRLGILVGDVAGKGLSAALLMSSLQARVQVLIDEPGDLANLMSRLNTSVARTCPGNRFVTFFLCAYDPATGELAYSNAGHNPPYLVRAASGEIEALTAGGPVLGILPGARYESASMQLERGDVVVMFSDGITEAQSPTQEEYGEERLLEAIRPVARMTAAEIAKTIGDSVEAFMANAPAADDITLVVARRV